jgi:hypothetical protein
MTAGYRYTLVSIGRGYTSFIFKACAAYVLLVPPQLWMKHYLQFLLSAFFVSPLLSLVDRLRSVFLLSMEWPVGSFQALVILLVSTHIFLIAHCFPWGLDTWLPFPNNKGLCDLFPGKLSLSACSIGLWGLARPSVNRGKTFSLQCMD